jgi:hypothetical protein
MNIVELDVDRINNPVQTDDGTTCHFIDRDNIEVPLDFIYTMTIENILGSMHIIPLLLPPPPPPK